MFVLDSTWQVAAGEESKEVEIQNQREMRVLEAVYPRPSAIPPNPSVLMGIEDSHNDLNTPQISITPIEDEDADTSVDPMVQNTIPMSSQAPLLAPGMPTASQGGSSSYPNPNANGNAVAAGMIPGVEPDVAAAAQAALTAIMTSNDQGSLIDQDLLIKILSNPTLIEKLIADHIAAANPQTMPPMPRPPGIILSEPPPVQISRAEAGGPQLAGPPSGQFYTPPNRVGPIPAEVLPVPSPPVGPPVAKDINYYKSLIQQHGGERQENPPQFGSSHHNHQLGVNQESVNNPTPRDLKPKIMKPCIYFNSSRGCRHGSNCSYRHDASSLQRASSMPEVQSAKRMKLDREITAIAISKFLRPNLSAAVWLQSRSFSERLQFRSSILSTAVYNLRKINQILQNLLQLHDFEVRFGTLRLLQSESASSYHLNGGPSYMRGVMFTEPNKPLTIEEFHMPRPKAGEVLIKTKACGVCHSDLHVIIGELPFASPCVV
ncbi:hypothetical protein TEA_009854 [Camellia sinensis var. sinensis]|uniref:C3H1-type domain-containing protein n=1 Tax=Camellia sinensis var. sinensis TaxID=542762 RepID=A0A4S4E2U7_CAMSN|nr:hypothetical protein TEA_009854 [Camellia sinensis var. sinensis]